LAGEVEEQRPVWLRPRVNGYDEYVSDPDQAGQGVPHVHGDLEPGSPGSGEAYERADRKGGAQGKHAEQQNIFVAKTQHFVLN